MGERRETAAIPQRHVVDAIREDGKRRGAVRAGARRGWVVDSSDCHRTATTNTNADPVWTLVPSLPAGTVAVHGTTLWLYNANQLFCRSLRSTDQTRDRKKAEAMQGQTPTLDGGPLRNRTNLVIKSKLDPQTTAASAKPCGCAHCQPLALQPIPVVSLAEYRARLRRNDFAPCDADKLSGLQAQLDELQIAILQLRSQRSHSPARVRCCATPIPQSTQSARLKDLVRTHNSTQAALESLPSLAAPIRKLPPEVLLRVFSLLIPTTVEYARPWDAPIILSAVCAHWRGLILRESGFWTSIDLSSHPSRVSHALQHSNDRLLAVIYCNREEESPDLTLLESLLPRVKSLTLDRDVDDTGEIQLDSGKLPHLRGLAITSGSFDYLQQYLRQWTRLTFLDLRDIPVLSVDICDILTDLTSLLHFQVPAPLGIQVPGFPLPLRTFVFGTFGFLRLSISQALALKPFLETTRIFKQVRTTNHHHVQPHMGVNGANRPPGTGTDRAYRLERQPGSSIRRNGPLLR
uniref:F-box domain-containing protein n=1 Tax=Mycena chlorophos TaxID=658473 RepID=A0ABQ0LUM8_MYCCL|nr:predicted protein [Mycena chlorophos]